MQTEALIIRSDSQCEICKSTNNLSHQQLLFPEKSTLERDIYVCETCWTSYIDKIINDINHWRCLNETVWSEVSAIKIFSWQILALLKNENWAIELKEMMYLDNDEIACTHYNSVVTEDEIKHVDSNGVILNQGDSVVLIKDLQVKGANFTAKRGTAVRNIHLDKNNSEHIEGKVNGQSIVILTKYIKK